jgi:LysR family transcriptional regulator of gallate degradation
MGRWLECCDGREEPLIFHTGPAHLACLAGNVPDRYRAGAHLKDTIGMGMNETPGLGGADDPERDLPLSLKALRSAVAVAAHGSAARAAAITNKSPTTVTRNIQLLEATLGLPLFERRTAGMVPTAAGRVVVARARRAFDQLEHGAREARNTATHSDPARDTRLARLVNARLLFVLIAVAETGSEGRAAERLSLSQPAVSQAIRDLEHLASAQLVERTSRGVHLTEPGELLLRRIKLALTELRVAEEEVASMQGLLRGHVTIASLPFSSVELVPQAVTKFLSLHPELKVTIVDGTYDSLMNQLRSADVDMIVGTLRASVFDDIEQEALFDDTLSVVCRVGHPFTKMAHVALSDVVHAPWVVPLLDTVTRTSFEEAFRTENVGMPPIRLEVHNPMVVRSILLKSDHLALLSPLQVRSEIAAQQLTVLPIALRGTQRTIGLTMRGDDAPSPGMKALLHELRTAATELT